jgi:hypothetical protein
VDHVVLFEEDTPHRLLEAIRPDVLVKGGTYTVDQVVGHEIVERYGGRVCVTSTQPGVSTTKLVAQIRSPEPRDSRVERERRGVPASGMPHEGSESSREVGCGSGASRDD